MFPIFNAAGARVPLVWDDDYTMNSGDQSDNIIEVDGFSVRDVFAGTIEPYSDRNGFEAYRVHRASKIIRISGIIRGTSHVDALSKFETMAGRFDPNQLWIENTTASGFSTLSWVDAGGLTNTYEARPLSSPDLIHNIYQAANVPFTIDLLAQPWRGVTQVSSTVASGSNVVNAGDVNGAPILTRSQAGAWASNVILSNSTTGESMTFNLSTLSGGTVTVDMLNHRVLHNTTPIDHLLTAGTWWELRPGSNGLVFTNFASPTVTRYNAYRSK